jgi:hypothetical protein
MIRKFVGAQVAFALAAVLVGCPKKNPIDDGGLAALFGDAAIVAPGSFTEKPIENENDVTVYPQQQKRDEVTALQRQAVTHKSPPNGPDLATLPAGTTVKKIAQKETNFLIAYDDPTTGKRMCGWVGEEAFTPAPAATTATAKWVPPVVKDAGGVAVQDAGGVAVQDAGGTSPAKDAGGAVATHDAGGGGASGACPPGQRAVTSGGKQVCLKLCAKNGDCPDGNRCSATKFGAPAVCVPM